MTLDELNRGMIWTNLLTKFHEDQARNVASKVKTSPPTGGHVFQRTGTTFELNQDIIKTNILTNFKFDRNITGSKLLTKFHEDQTRNVASRVFTRKTAPITGGHVFQLTGTAFYVQQHIMFTSFELDRGIIGTNLLTKFHEDRTRNVASGVLTRKTAPPTGGHVFQRIGTTFKLNQYIIQTNIDKRLKARPSFKLNRDIIGKKILTKFHEDRTRNVASRVFTRILYSQIRKTAPPNGSHVFQLTRTTFELNQNIIKTTILTKLHEDWA
ncbi:hypothetical protein DPMN_118517 [Dreissena polymorpha]|uniref:Uncharacterized protein n=1 Tax=Dreissena polymorpha TaxID=45954 RepID=A0A9D4GN90_DREPO|nr:hypothetical protein DPMN_118517 [Dreissena polymorpha]